MRGLYDIVNGEFYSNNGEGLFSIGNEENEIFEFVTSSTELKIDKNHILYAEWGHNPTVTLNPNGGEVAQSIIKYNYNSTYINLPTPTKTGFRFLGWKALNLEYMQVEYIITYGNQYIDTGISTQNNKNHEYILEFRPNNSNGWSGVNGSMQLNILGTSNNRKIYDVKYNGTTGTEEIYIDGTLTENQSWGIGNYLGAIYLGKLSNHNSSGISGEIYSFKLYENNELIRDLVPCFRITGGEIGMCDILNYNFYLNKGSGNFEKGSDVSYAYESNYITSTTAMITNDDHTLYAIWEEE